MLIDFRKKGREGEGEKYRLVVSHLHPHWGDRTHSLGTCPDWESNPWPFVFLGWHSSQLSHTGQGWWCLLHTFRTTNEHSLVHNCFLVKSQEAGDQNCSGQGYGQHPGCGLCSRPAMEAGAQWGHTLTPLCFLSLALRVSQLCVSSPQVWRG